MWRGVHASTDTKAVRQLQPPQPVQPWPLPKSTNIGPSASAGHRRALPLPAATASRHCRLPLHTVTVRRHRVMQLPTATASCHRALPLPAATARRHCALPPRVHCALPPRAATARRHCTLPPPAATARALKDSTILSTTHTMAPILKTSILSRSFHS